MKLLVVASLLAAAYLRLSHPAAIEFKFDEAETLHTALRFAHGEIGLPWVGQPSSNGLRHPGLGLWPFLLAARYLGATTPAALARVPQFLGLLQLLLLLALARIGFRGRARAYLTLATCLLAVNPFWVLLERKAWHPSLLGFFEGLFLLAWRFRSRKVPAFLAGLLALVPGQVHMGGFFFLIGLVAVSWAGRWRWQLRHLRLGPFLAGLGLGLASLLPWLRVVLFEPNPYPLSFKLVRLLDFKFVNFWWSHAYGILTDYPFGAAAVELLSGPAGIATAILAVVLLLQVPVHWKRLFSPRRFRLLFRSERCHELSQWEFSVFFGMAATTMLSLMLVPRYFLLAAGVFPLLSVARAGIAPARSGTKSRLAPDRVFLVIWLCQLALSLATISFIAQRTATIPGDFGTPLFLQ